MVVDPGAHPVRGSSGHVLLAVGVEQPAVWWPVIRARLRRRWCRLGGPDEARGCRSPMPVAVAVLRRFVDFVDQAGQPKHVGIVRKLRLLAV